MAPGLGVVTEPGRHFAGHLGGAGTWPAPTSTLSMPDARMDSVSVSPGAIEKAQMPCDANSTWHMSVTRWNAALAAA